MYKKVLTFLNKSSYSPR